MRSWRSVFGPSRNPLQRNELRCCGLDLNQHTLSGTSPSSWRQLPVELVSPCSESQPVVSQGPSRSGELEHWLATIGSEYEKKNVTDEVSAMLQLQFRRKEFLALTDPEFRLRKGLTTSLQRCHNSRHGNTKEKTGEQSRKADWEAGKSAAEEKTEREESYWNGSQDCEWQTNERKAYGGEGVW